MKYNQKSPAFTLFTTNNLFKRHPAWKHIEKVTMPARNKEYTKHANLSVDAMRKLNIFLTVVLYFRWFIYLALNVVYVRGA